MRIGSAGFNSRYSARVLIIVVKKHIGSQSNLATIVVAYIKKIVASLVSH